MTAGGRRGTGGGRSGSGGDLAFGVDIGGTKVLGVAIAGPDVVAEARVQTPAVATDPTQWRGAASGKVAEAVCEVVTKLARSSGAPGVLPPVGVGVPGMLETTGILRFSPNLPGAVGSAMAELVAERLSARGATSPVLADNDANCAALAEVTLGSAQGASDVVMVTLGTGIGGALVVDGKVLSGAHGFAGEMGHMVVDPSGPACPCGRRGCWERFASGGGLGRLAREAAFAGTLHDVVELAGGDPELVRGEHVTQAALDGDPGALAVMEQLGWWVALGLANLVAVSDPECIVIGGGLAEVGDILFSPTRAAFAALVEGGEARAVIRIVPAALGERAGAVGAALMARCGGRP